MQPDGRDRRAGRGERAAGSPDQLRRNPLSPSACQRLIPTTGPSVCGPVSPSASGTECRWGLSKTHWRVQATGLRAPGYGTGDANQPRAAGRPFALCGSRRGWNLCRSGGDAPLLARERHSLMAAGSMGAKSGSDSSHPTQSTELTLSVCALCGTGRGPGSMTTGW